MVLVGLPGLWRLRHDRLDAVGLYVAMTVVSFGVLAVLWLGSPALPAPGIGHDDVAQALLIVALGLLAFAVGARAAGAPKARPPLRFDASGAASRWLLVVLFAGAATVTALGLALGVIGYRATTTGSGSMLASAQIFAQASGVGTIIVLVCAMQAFAAGDAVARRSLPWLLAGQIAVGFVAGFKGQALLPVIYTVLALLASTTSVPWRSLALVVVATFGFLLPANLIYRTVLRDASQDAPAEVVKAATQYMSARFRLIDHVALIHARTPGLYAYGDGNRYRYLPAMVAVPRALWPNKPVLDDGVRFSQTYWEIPPLTRTSTPLTQIGDLLRNFGLVGVGAGLAVWGVVVGGFVTLFRFLRSPRAEMIYIVSLVSWITYVEQDLPTLIASASRSLPVTIALAWVLLPGRSQPAGYHVLLRSARRVSKRLRRAA